MAFTGITNCLATFKKIKKITTKFKLPGTNLILSWTTSPSHALAPELQLPVDGRHSTASAAVDVDAL